MAEWTEGERYIVPGLMTQSFLRATAEDERVATALSNSAAVLRFESRRGGEWPVRELYEAGVGYVQSIIVGLAVAGTINMEAGATGRWLGLKIDEVKPELPRTPEDIVRRFRWSLDQR